MSFTICRVCKVDAVQNGTTCDECRRAEAVDRQWKAKIEQAAAARKAAQETRSGKPKSFRPSVGNHQVG